MTEYKINGVEIDEEKVDLTELMAENNDEDKARREAEPDAFALSYDEAVDVRRAYNIFSVYHAQSPDQTNRAFIEKVKEIMEANGIDVNAIFKIADRVLSGDWFTLRLVATAQPVESNLHFELCAQINGLSTQRILSDESDYMAYDPTGRVSDMREQVGLPNTALYLYQYEHDILDILQYYHTHPDDDISSIRTKKLDTIRYPLDPLSNNIWGGTTQIIPGKFIGINAAKRGTRHRVDIVYSINWDDVTEGNGVSITKELDAYDKGVYNAISNLYITKQNPMTISMIYNAMGFDGQPGASDRKKITDSINKMGSARIFIDNSQEIKQGYKYAQIVDDYQLLYFHRRRAIFNGELVEAAFYFLEEPVIFAFSRSRNEFTTFKRAMLQANVSKTTQNAKIEDYLLRRIGQARQRGNRKILFSSVCEQCKATTTKQRQRVPDKVKRYMDHFIAIGEIDGAEYDDRSVTIIIGKEAKKRTRKGAGA